MDCLLLGDTYPGTAYADFQRELLKLYHSGILLALCSKNDAAQVFQVFDRHPAMILKKKHICAYRINWKSKSENLLALSKELSIGLDSMLFVDDSEHEIHEVKHCLPAVETLFLNSKRTYEYVPLLRSCSYFDNTALTAEDRNRSKFYLQ